MSEANLNIGGMPRTVTDYTTDPSQVGGITQTQAPAEMGTIDPAALLAANQTLASLMQADGMTLALEEGASTDPRNVGETAQNVSTLSENVQTDLFEFLKLFAKISQEMRNAAREQRTAEMQAQVASLKDAAQEIRDGAVARLISGVITGAVQIASGAVSIGFAASAAKSVKANAKPDVGPEISPDMKAMNLKNADIATARGQGISQLSQGVGQVGSSAANYVGSQADADKAEAEAEAKTHEMRSDEAKDMMDQALQQLQKILETFQAMEQAKIDTTKGIARNI